jgi:hypothetical protein
MAITPNIDHKLREVAERAENFLEGVDQSPFSSTAFSVLQERIALYVSELVKESAIIAKRDNADSISTKHVEVACEHLTLRSRGRIYKHLGTIGGICLGASLSTLISMITINQYPSSAVLISVLLGIIGGALFAINMMMSLASATKPRLTTHSTRPPDSISFMVALSGLLGCFMRAAG